MVATSAHMTSHDAYAQRRKCDFFGGLERASRNKKLGLKIAGNRERICLRKAGNKEHGEGLQNSGNTGTLYRITLYPSRFIFDERFSK